MGLPKQQIIDSYEWARRYASRCTLNFPGLYDREDLTSAGIVGYVMAAYRYDSNKGSSFRSFCATRIRGAIMDEIRRLTWESRSAWRNHQLLNRTKFELESNLERKPTNDEVAEALGIDQSDLQKIQRLSQPPSFVSLDDDSLVGNGDEHLPLKEIIADESVVGPSDEADLSEIRRALCSCISRLPPAEAKVVVMYYLRNISFSEIAQAMKLSPSRISQLHHQALITLKQALRTKLKLTEE